MVLVYSLPNCVQCETTKKVLNKKGIEYEEINLAENEEAMQHVRDLGYSAAPVVEIGDVHWSGFRVEMLNRLKVAV
jgi:glutaredoxin-like protein NrdH